LFERTDIRIHPGQNAAFEEAIQHGIATVAGRAKDVQGYQVNRGIESPERYIETGKNCICRYSFDTRQC
jgi:hypothetical protein